LGQFFAMRSGKKYVFFLNNNATSIQKSSNNHWWCENSSHAYAHSDSNSDWKVLSWSKSGSRWSNV